MKKKYLDEALALGFTTQSELKAFEYGIIAAEKEAIEKRMNDQELAWLEADYKPVTVTMNGKRIK